MKNDNNLIKGYATFLESTLKELGYNFSEMGIMEIMDPNFNITSEYLGRISDEESRTYIKSLRTVTENYLDDYLEDYTIFPDINVVYSQMPFHRPGELIKKLALVPVLTPSVAVFGAYGFKRKAYQRSKNIEAIEEFASQLDNNGLDFNIFNTQTADKYYKLIISRNKEMHR